MEAVTPRPAVDDRAPFEPLALTALDGVPLVGRYFAPAGVARGAVLLANAMGVPQGFYGPLARWLARQGYHALTFDYRGVGLSRRGSLRGLEADVMTWARRDAPAALQALRDRAPALPLTWLGHSLGGQILPFVPEHSALAKVVTVATGSGYWRENAAPTRRKVWLFWYLAVPLATPLLGYFPGRTLRMVGDLPRGAVEQWRRWCLDPEYAVGVEPGASALFAAVRTPIAALSFTDDEMLSARNTESLHAHFTGAPLRLQRVAPDAVGLRSVGHFGFFRHEVLWERLLRPELASSTAADPSRSRDR